MSGLFLMSLGSMSHGDFKKWPCRRVKFRDQEPPRKAPMTKRVHSKVGRHVQMFVPKPRRRFSGCQPNVGFLEGVRGWFESCVWEFCLGVFFPWLVEVLKGKCQGGTIPKEVK